MSAVRTAKLGSRSMDFREIYILGDWIKSVENIQVWLKSDKNNRHFFMITYRSFATTVSQLKMCDFSEEKFKGFEVL